MCVGQDTGSIGIGTVYCDRGWAEINKVARYHPATDGDGVRAESFRGGANYTRNERTLYEQRDQKRDWGDWDTASRWLNGTKCEPYR